MKQLFLLFLIALTTQMNAQNDKKQSQHQVVTQIMDLVVEIPKLEPGKNFEALKEKLSNISGLKVEGFCSGAKLLYLRFSPDQYFNVLVAINEAGYAYYIKKDTNINRSIESCADKGGLYLRESTDVTE